MYFSHCQGILTASSWRAVERTHERLDCLSGRASSGGSVRRHWHTEEFGRVVGGIIARRDKPKAFSAFNLSDKVGPTTDRHMNHRAQLDEFAQRYAKAWCSRES